MWRICGTNFVQRAQSAALKVTTTAAAKVTNPFSPSSKNASHQSKPASPTSGTSKSSSAVPAKAAQSKPKQPAAKTAVAAVDYIKQGPKELDLTKGTKLIILDDSHADWYKAQVDERKGMVPKAYVKLL